MAGGYFGTKKEYGKLNCFSPPVMVATFVIEAGLAVYTLWRYKLSAVTRLAVLIFVCLATFQQAEFMVCRGSINETLVWSRIGYVAISLLPPLGLHLITTIAKAGKRWLWLVLPSYASAVVYIIFFGFVSGALTGHQCLGNYVIFQIGPGVGWLYGAYYYGWLLVSLATAIYFMLRTHQRKMKREMVALAVAYAAFMLPTTTANLLSPSTLSGVPSIMCGFAVFMALILGFVVLPLAAQKRR